MIMSVSIGTTSISMFWEARHSTLTSSTRASYVFAGDMNGDGVAANDLIYIPKDTSEMNFAAFTAAVLGGIGSIAGAAVGGLILGLLQSVGPALILTGFGVPSPYQLKDAFTFLVLVMVLIFRPGGLLGTGEAEKL